MSGLADCRRCWWFCSLSDLEYQSVDWRKVEEAYVRAHREGREVLGWCLKRDAPVFYYTGRCRHFRPWPGAQATMDEFL